MYRQNQNHQKRAFFLKLLLELIFLCGSFLFYDKKFQHNYLSASYFPSSYRLHWITIWIYSSGNKAKKIMKNPLSPLLKLVNNTGFDDESVKCPTK